MMTPYSTNAMLDILSGKSAEPISNNEDMIAHQHDVPVVAPGTVPDTWLLRLLPGFARGPLKAWIAARRYEHTLVGLWEVSPHLLDDMGVVLTTKGTLPEHLVAAPARVIDHVAAIAPEQIVAADMQFPPAAKAGGPDAQADRAAGQARFSHSNAR